MLQWYALTVYVINCEQNNHFHVIKCGLTLYLQHSMPGGVVTLSVTFETGCL